MSDSMLYLKEDVYFEPLFNHWYAWSYLLPPVTGARHTVNTHLRIMKSFIKNYRLHILASKEATLTGGEFLNCSEEQLTDIQSLIDETNESCTDLIQLSTAVEELDELLRNHTNGESIDYLYSQVPDVLKGYVELFMDMEHRATYRFLEPLLYESRLYKPELQGASFGLISKVGDRPFVLSTPRLPDNNHLQLAVDFNHPLLETIFKTRETPISSTELEKLMAPHIAEDGLSYQELFTEDKSEYLHTPVAKGLRLQYIGHAGFLVETANVAVLIDPVIASRGAKYAGDVISFSELPPKIDYIFLTHNHQDHVCIETLLQLRHKTEKIIVPKNNGGSIADPSIRLMLKQLGFDVVEVDDLDEIDLVDGRVISLPFLGEHGDLNVRSKAAWLFELAGKKVFFGADSSNPDPQMYRHLKKILGGIDVLCLGMESVGAPYTWLYGALHTKMVSKSIKNSRRLNGSNFQQALGMVETFKPEEVYIYALGMEPWYKYFMGIEYDDDSEQIIESNKLINACSEINIKAERLFGKKTLEYLS